MKQNNKRLWITYTLAFLTLTYTYPVQAEDKKTETTMKTEETTKNSECNKKEEFVETSHQVVIDGRTVAYKAIAGNLILKDEQCEPKASMFFISYTKEGESNTNERPITFCFNGGPGSSAVWLHMGLMGPKRVFLTDNGDALPPYRLVENEFSLIDVTDLVFIDPVTTGYSRAVPPKDAKEYHGTEADIKTMASFIRLYLSRYERWDSPKFLAGESYGTTRAAGLASHLFDKDFINMNGLILISTVLDFQSLEISAMHEGTDLTRLLSFPSLTAAAWYHKKLPPDLQGGSLETALIDSQEFVTNEYSVALFKGSALSKAERDQIVKKIARFSGLTPDYIDRSNLRIQMGRFLKELLRSEKRTIGRFDARFVGIDSDAVGGYAEYDPSMTAIFGAFTSTFNDYVRKELNWKEDANYRILTSKVWPWDWGAKNEYLNVSENLRGVMTQNPHMRVFVASGCYDMAIPYYGTEYSFSHLGLDPSLLEHVTEKVYEGGHMMYISKPILEKMKGDMSRFYRETLRDQAKEEIGLNLAR